MGIYACVKPQGLTKEVKDDIDSSTPLPSTAALITLLFAKTSDSVIA